MLALAADDIEHGGRRLERVDKLADRVAVLVDDREAQDVLDEKLAVLHVRVGTQDLDGFALESHGGADVVHALEAGDDELLVLARGKDPFLRAADEQALEGLEKRGRIEPDLDLDLAVYPVGVDDPSGFDVLLHGRSPLRFLTY